MGKQLPLLNWSSFTDYPPTVQWPQFPCIYSEETLRQDTTVPSEKFLSGVAFRI